MPIQNSISNTIKGSIINGGGPGADFSTKSLSFDGTDEYINTTEDYLEISGDSQATFSFWFKLEKDSSIQYPLSCYDGANARFIFGIRFQRLSPTDARVWFYLNTANNSDRSYANLGSVTNDGAWHHLLIGLDLTQPSNSETRFFLDGLELTRYGYHNSSVITSFNGLLTIGNRDNTYSGYYGGYIDEVAIWGGQDLSSDVATIWNNGKPADLTATKPTSWYRAGENSTFAYPQILIPEDTNKDKVSKYSLDFDGTSDYIDLGNPTELQITDVLSISFWFKSSSTSDQAVISKDTLGQRCFAIWNNQYGTGQNLEFVIYNSNSATSVISSTNPNDGNWHHVVCVFNPSTYLRIYVDGILNAENTTSIPTSIDNDTANFLIGGIISSGSPVYMFEGNVNEVAVWSDDLSASANAIYNGGVPNDIASLYPTRLEGYWKLGEEAKFTDNWLVPNSALSNFSKYSFNFDGQDDYINCGNNANLQPTTEISVSAWFKTSSLTRQTIASRTYYRLRLGLTGELEWAVFDSAATGVFAITSGVNYADNQWHNVVCTHQTNGRSKIYVDGTLQVDIAGLTTNVFNTSIEFLIGRRNFSVTQFFVGNIDEVAVWTSELSAGTVTAIYNGGKPKDLSGLSPVSWWRMGEEATYDGTTSQFTIPDQGSGGNTGTSSNTMLLETLVGDTPQYYGGGISDSMDIFDRVGDAPKSKNNTVSYNMEEADIVEDTP